MLWLRAIILVSLLLLGLNIQSVSLVEANGSIRSYEKKVIGKYIIGLGTAPPSPTIGVTHFAAFVEDKETGVKYMDADIEFFAVLSGPNQQKIGPYQDQMPARKNMIPGCSQHIRKTNIPINTTK